MKNRSVRLTVIVFVAVIGVVMATGSVVRLIAHAGPPFPPEHGLLGGADGAWWVDAGYDELDTLLVQPTEESAPQLVEEAVSSVRTGLGELPPDLALSEARSSDFLDLFSERLAMHLAPSYEENLRAIASRGGDIAWLDNPESAAAHRASWEAQSRVTSLGALAPGLVEIRARFKGGRILPVDPPSEPRITTWNKSLFEIPEDAASGGLDVYEALVPYKVSAVDGTPTVALVGYAFAWSPGQERWLPWRIWMYSAGKMPISPNFP